MKPQLLLLLFVPIMLFAKECNHTKDVLDSTNADFIVTYGGIGVSYTDLEDLNTTLGSYGINRIDQGAFRITGGEELHFKRFITGGTFSGYMWKIAENDHRRSVQLGFDVGALIGYDIIPKEKVSLFPFAGFTIGTLFHQLAYIDEAFSDVAQGSAPSDQMLWQFTVNTKVGVGFDFHFVKDDKNPTVGIRAGYQFDISDGDRWYRDISTVAGGPSVEMSGPFVDLVFGIVHKKEKE